MGYPSSGADEKDARLMRLERRDPRGPQPLTGRRESQMLRFLACSKSPYGGASLTEGQLTVAQWLIDQGADPKVSLRIPGAPFLQVPALHAATIASAVSKNADGCLMLIAMMLGAADVAAGAAT